MSIAEGARSAPSPTGDYSEWPTVLVILVTHRGRAWLKDCLTAIKLQTYPLLDVLVVDDASPDYRDPPHLKRVAKRHLRGRRWAFLRTPRPLGFGGAANWAMSRIRTDADLLLFLHDDAVLDPPAVERMVARMLTDDNTAIVGPKVVAWDDADRLEEVGMAADRFGYPYKGLEQDEIDLGQHDASKEVLYVTSTCVLMRHEVFRSLNGWDARMRAFSEDLDLCWRARIAGHSVRVEPAARVRHAMALATGQRDSPFSPSRYFIRRNRLRTVAKNVSGIRLVFMLPQFVLLSLGEMLGFLVLRQPGEILNLARALGWNVLTFPQTLSERGRAQRMRRVGDDSVRRFTVRETTRVRSYVAHQADRLEEAWGRRTELLQRRRMSLAGAAARLRGWEGLAVAVAVVGFLLGFRHFLWAPPASLGELLPFPEAATSLWRAWSSAWSNAGLGQPASSPPALALLGTVQVLCLGAESAAQKILVLGLGAAAFAGAQWLVSDLVDRPARLAAGLAYALGAVGYAALRGGALGAMVFGSAAPFVLGSMLRLTGWMRPPRWSHGRAVARVALGAAVSAAFVPGSLVIYALCAMVLFVLRRATMPRAKALRGFTSSMFALVVAWLMLLPWSASWFAEGGALSRLFGADTWRTYAAAYRGHGMASVLAGQTPDVPPLLGLALPLLGTVAVIVSEGQRRRIALALWGLIALTGMLVSATSAGLIRPVVANPIEAGVVAAAAFAGLVGLAVGAFRLDLPRRGLGLTHALTLASLALATFLIVSGLTPALWEGAWAPGREAGRANAHTVAQIRSLLTSETSQEGGFRTLWVGRAWGPPVPTTARPPRDYFVSSARGQSLADLFERDSGEGDQRLDDVLSAVASGATDRGGSLLGAFNVHYVVVDRGPGASRWLAQRDLAIFRSSGSYVILENQAKIPRAAVYSDMPSIVEAVSGRALLPSPEDIQVAPRPLEGISRSRYRLESVEGPAVAYLAVQRDPRWNAASAGAPLERADGGWANAWNVPSGSSGPLEVRFRRSAGDIVLLVVVVLLWVVVAEAAISRSRPRLRGGRGR